MKKLTRVQKTTRFIVYSFILLNLTGILPTIVAGNLLKILG